jgi:hypothetical protein
VKIGMVSELEPFLVGYNTRRVFYLFFFFFLFQAGQDGECIEG